MTYDRRNTIDRHRQYYVVLWRNRSTRASDEKITFFFEYYISWLGCSSTRNVDEILNFPRQDVLFRFIFLRSKLDTIAPHTGPVATTNGAVRYGPPVYFRIFTVRNVVSVENFRLIVERMTTFRTRATRRPDDDRSLVAMLFFSLRSADGFRYACYVTDVEVTKTIIKKKNALVTKSIYEWANSALPR